MLGRCGVVAKIAACSKDAKCACKNSSLVIHKRDGKISSLLEVVWQHNWLFVGSGLVAKIAGVMAELAPRFSGRNLGNGFALFGIGFMARERKPH
jgi:hypothetical protein